MTVLKFDMASVLASEIVCMFISISNGDEYITVEIRGGTQIHLKRVGYDDKACDLLERYTIYWKNALNEDD